MLKTIVILGRGKVATALERVFSESFHVIKLSRADFNALRPQSVDELLRAYAPVYVFNTVVWGGLDDCARNPAEAMLVNTLFPLHVAELSSQLGFTLIHFSTDAVFSDSDGGIPRLESSAAHPPNIYAHTKHGADTMIPLRTEHYFLYRLPLVFGPSPSSKQLLERMVARLRAGESLRVAGDIFSHAVYSLDVACAVKEHLAANPAPGLYHLAGAERSSLYELVSMAADVLGCTQALREGCAADFPGLDYKNRNIHLASEKVPALRSWRESLLEYCNCGLCGS